MSEIKKKHIVSEEQAGERLDVMVSQVFGMSRSQAQKLIKQGAVCIHTVPIQKTGHIVVAGDAIEEKAPDLIVQEKGMTIQSTLLVDVVAETDEYIVINKPTGMLVHATQAGESGTVVDWLIANYPGVAAVGDSPERPGIVHRLDREASGLLVIAKTQQMFDYLKQQFQERAMEKEYSVLVHGTMSVDHGTIDFDIDRGKDGTMVSRPHVNELSLRGVVTKQPGKEALTEYWVEKQFSRFALLNVRIHTGRTHQIRVHMFAYNHPVVGDQLYFNKKLNRKRDRELGRLFLHARRLCFLDLSGEKQCFEQEMPVELRNFLSALA